MSLPTYERDEIKRKTLTALSALVQSDRDLLDLGVGERAFSHRLAVHLQAEFPDHSVDCEYNRRGRQAKAVDTTRQRFLQLLREGGIPKRLATSTVASGKRPVSIYPDIVVHVRGKDDHNILAMEIKRAGSSSPFDVWDRWKLNYYLDKLRYTAGAFLVLPSEPPSQVEDWPIEWFPKPDV